MTLSALIVDDNAPLRTAIARSMQRRGWQVATAADGMEGLEAVRGKPFDVVVSDVNMPRRGGVWLWEEALALRPELRGRFILISSEPLSETRIMARFLMTSEPQLEPRIMARFLESEHFFLTPVSLATLCDEVQSVVQRAKEIRNEPQSA